MGKDREGKYIPPKGKPSGKGDESELGLRPNLEGTTLEQDGDITQRYTENEEKPAANVRVLHPNRNVLKGEEELAAPKPRPAAGAPSHSGKQITPEGITEINTLDREIFTQLSNHRAPLTISVYLPTHSRGVEVNEQQDSIALKHLVRQVELALLSNGAPRHELGPLMECARIMVHDDQFWRNQREGLAIFLAPGNCRFIRLPYSVKQEFYINHTFYLSPLLPLLTADERFYLLALSKHRATLYEADAWGMHEVEVPGMPRGVEDVVHFEEKDDQKLFRTSSSGAGQGANYHGIGAGKPDDKANISMYLDEVDETLWKEVLHDSNIPLMLAGVEYLHPIFRQRTKYRHMADAALTGNMEHVPVNDLFRSAREAMEPWFCGKCEKAIERFNNNTGNKLSTTDPAEIIPACYYARTDLLLVAEGAHLWGAFVKETNQLQLHDQEQEGDECMVNAAVTQALMNGAEVHVMDPDKMPSGAVMAAVMRYQQI
ncbi:hypothetical protein [Chitinophaga sp.]|uniref:baeRF7 domain-containing protein n=1 Tax=Chitinophaga sp. TaxID=1869181 RepID=UPI00260BF3B8|nr:hypothetical protein [uncultured Chitinophaga sp.]